MKRMVVAIVLFAVIMVEEAYTSDLELARKFSPILVLAEDTGNKWGDIRVIKPEPVEIRTHMAGANFYVTNWREFNKFNPPLVFPHVDFARSHFALIPQNYEYPGIPAPNYPNTTYTIETLPFQYPGNDPAGWNASYFGEESESGDVSGGSAVPQRPDLDPRI